MLLEQYDRSVMSGAKFAQYIGIKYSTLAYWLQSRRGRNYNCLSRFSGLSRLPDHSRSPLA
jgi:hypothetical protein